MRSPTNAGCQCRDKGSTQNRLLDAGVRAGDAGSILTGARSLLEDADFWRHQSDELAVYVIPSVFEHFRLPLDLEELVVVAGHFHIRPLLEYFAGDERFCVLGGFWSREDDEPAVLDRHVADAGDLLDAAAAETLLKGGAVYSLEPGEGTRRRAVDSGPGILRIALGPAREAPGACRPERPCLISSKTIPAGDT